MDRLYTRIFDESLLMTEMKDSGELEDHPDFIKFADQVEGIWMTAPTILLLGKACGAAKNR